MTPTKTQRWSLLLTVAAGLLLITLDNSVLYTALPTLTKELGATPLQGLWIINAYPLVMAGLLLGAGTLGDRLGHRRLFLIGLVIFGIASLLAAFAPDANLLIAARALYWLTNPDVLAEQRAAQQIALSRMKEGDRDAAEIAAEVILEEAGA